METKLVNGVRVPLSEADLAQRALDEARWQAGAAERLLKKVYKMRVEEYGSVAEQLDMIFHDGIDVWKAHIQAVKDKYPKDQIPNEGPPIDPRV